jgi:hypothetical protein
MLVAGKMNSVVSRYLTSSFSTSSPLLLSEVVSDSIPTKTPEDLEAEELEAYAEEYTALADFEDLDAIAEELFSYSDLEDEHQPEKRGKSKAIPLPLDDDMDMTG